MNATVRPSKETSEDPDVSTEPGARRSRAASTWGVAASGSDLRGSAGDCVGSGLAGIADGLGVGGAAVLDVGAEAEGDAVGAEPDEDAVGMSDGSALDVPEVVDEDPVGAGGVESVESAPDGAGSLAGGDGCAVGRPPGSAEPGAATATIVPPIATIVTAARRAPSKRIMNTDPISGISNKVG